MTGDEMAKLSQRSKSRFLAGASCDRQGTAGVDAAAGRRISHVWSGYVGMTFDKTAHMGERGGIVHAVGCNGNGVALMTYLGHQTALKLLGRQNRPCPSTATHFGPTRSTGARRGSCRSSAAGTGYATEWTV
jgi:glycine/D-amino acid oxidase-like deaminating enzyme